jgi:arylsulfatase
VLFGSVGRLSENCVLNLKIKSHSVTAEIVVPEDGAEGAIISQGANSGGWSLCAKGGKLKSRYNWGGFKHFYVEGTTPIPADDRQVRMEFAHAGGGWQGRQGNAIYRRQEGRRGERRGYAGDDFLADDDYDDGADSRGQVAHD